jgi:arabinogalactan endo-1,4-beta-galactosidase
MDEDETRRGPSRRTLVANGSAAAGLGFPSGPAALPAAPGQLFCAPLAPFRVSLSVSPFSEAVLQTTRLTDGDYVARTVADLQNLYLRHGATEVYARIATRKAAPQGAIADHGWGRGLERARMAKAMDLPFNPELGLWAEYGDGGNYQQPPDFRDYPEVSPGKPWSELSLDEMLPPLRRYGAIVARQILATGAQVNMWDIGNEVESGIAGVTVRPLTPARDYRPPDKVEPAIGRMSTAQLVAMPEKDRISWSRAHLWPYVGRLIKATAEGVRSVDPKARFSTHISPIGQTTTAVHLAFWETLKHVGFTPDQFGLSYYPGLGRSHRGPEDTLQWFKDLATALKARYGRASFIAEGGYASGVMPPPFVFNDQVAGYPLDEEGQHRFNRDLISWGARSGTLAGYRPWAPDLCTGPGWAPMSWFKPHGETARPKPALRSFEEALPSVFVWVAAKLRDGGWPVLARTTGGAVSLTLEVRDGERLLAAGGLSAGRDWTRAVLRGRGRAGSHTLVVRSGDRVVMRRQVTLS